MPRYRIDKILKSQGMGSRKEVHTLINSKKIRINDIIIKANDIKIDPFLDEIFIDNKKLSYKEKIYVMMNKPKGILTATRDSLTNTVIDLLEDRLKNRELFPAGRLDKDTTGFVLLTDDGDFAHRLISPKSNIYKTYEAVLNASVNEKELEQFEKGIILEDGYVCLPSKIKILKDENTPLIEIKICEGKYHQIKRMFKSVNREVIELKRTKIGGLNLDLELNPCEYKELLESDIDLILK